MDSYIQKLKTWDKNGKTKQDMLLAQDLKETYKSKLIKDFKWFEDSFVNCIEQTFLNFWEKEYKVKLLSVIENNFTLFKTEEFFVTKIALKKNLDIGIRNSKTMIKMLFVCLGQKEEEFDITKITEIEAKIINSFNENIYEEIKDKLNVPQEKIYKENKIENYNLVFSIKNEENEIGKYIITIPKIAIRLPQFEKTFSNINLNNFSKTKTLVNINVGSTRMSLNDLKNLTQEDIVILENSNLNRMQLKIGEDKAYFQLSPDPTLIVNIEDNGDDNTMENSTLSQDMWDNIQVEIGAEFDKIKISLGELKQITEGLVVDIGSVYNNKIFLKVENKNIAQGELVIINDRYGVRIDKLLNDEAGNEQIVEIEQSNFNQERVNNVQEEMASEEVGEDDFDYSDFEIEDENI